MSRVICRDCAFETALAAAACPRCASPRVLALTADHDELQVAHADCDAFFATVEKRDHPELADKPVLVGGGRRGVVAAACYLARMGGARSAMPMFKALTLVPDAVVRRPDFSRYKAASHGVRRIMQETGAVLEPISIDEAYLGMEGVEAPVATLVRMALRIEQEVGVTVSIGLGPNRWAAKLASDMEKPRGFTILSQDAAERHLRGKPVRILRGVGEAMARRLNADGFATTDDVRRAGPARLESLYGRHGRMLYDSAYGRGRSEVAPPGKRKSVSSETTFGEDLPVGPALMERFSHVCRRTAERAEQADVRGRTLVLKLKDSRHQSLTRSETLSAPTRCAEVLHKTLEPHLQAEAEKGPFRLIGVGLGNLVFDDEAVQSTLPLTPSHAEAP
jgi:DNA polymerase-4